MNATWYQKAAIYKTECYRLKGVFSWLRGDRRDASNWWRKAISEGERLGARAQLSRAHAERGMRFLMIDGNDPAVDASEAQESLQKAKTMFTDLGLASDLEYLKAMMSRRGAEPLEN